MLRNRMLAASFLSLSCSCLLLVSAKADVASSADHQFIEAAGQKNEALLATLLDQNFTFTDQNGKAS